MPHPSEALLLALADDELGPAEHAQVSAHVDGCRVCRHALRDVRDAMAALRVEAAIVDAAEPASWREAVRPPLRPARASAPRARTGTPGHAPAGMGEAARRGTARGGARGDAAGAGVASVGRGPVASTNWGTGRARVAPLRWAAILLVFAAGGATAMLAPRWRALVNGGAAGAGAVDGGAGAAEATAGTARATAPLRTAAAVSVLPRDGRATVVLQPAGVKPAADAAVAPTILVVTVGERADVQVTVTSPLAAVEAPRFRTADGRLDVALAGNESRVEVEVPATLGEAHVVVGTRTVVTVRGGTVAPQRAATTGVPLGTER